MQVLWDWGPGGFNTTADLVLQRNGDLQSVVAGDLNGDGVVDLAAADVDGQAISLFFNRE